MPAKHIQHSIRNKR